MGDRKLTTQVAKLRVAPATSQAASLFDIPGCKFNKTSLSIPGSLSFDHWERLGGLLRSVEGSIQFWIGDWLRFGEERWGEKYAQATEVTGLDKGTLMNAAYVARNVQFSLRHENLSFSHHAAVASLKPDEQRTWLDKAEDEHMPYRELRRLVDREQRLQKFRLVSDILDKVWKRIQNGCYTPDSIMKCGECNRPVFDIDAEEIKIYMQQLVDAGKAEWRPQGGETDVARGIPTMLCVPKDMPYGSNYSAYRPVVDWGDDEEEYF